MLGKERAAEIFDRMRRFSAADEIEVLFTGSRFALTRFANNTIHQNVEEENSIAVDPDEFWREDGARFGQQVR